MSDFIYSKNTIQKGKLSSELKKIYSKVTPDIHEFHGDWGSLAITENYYNGYGYYQDNNYLCFIIGGPVLTFTENNFFSQKGGNRGTKIVLERLISEEIQWDEDLSGPFLIYLIDKKEKTIKCTTDLMSFIPAYYFQNEQDIFLSSHVDVLARISNQYKNIDSVSVVDFILHGVVTYPYTFYKKIRQLHPATVFTFGISNNKLESNTYWYPEEVFKYKSIKEAAEVLNHGLKSYVEEISSHQENIAHFISGGEDSRVLASLLPKNRKRDSFIFLDSMNREGKIAQKAAKIYGSNFNFKTRSKLHYLEILKPCSDLVGSGSQYFHVHTYGFINKCGLDEYNVVFGGFLSDTLLKGHHIDKTRWMRKFPFLPEIKSAKQDVDFPLTNSIFTDDMLRKISDRRKEHLNYISNIRKKSAEEWFYLWPISMHDDFPNLHGNRRLFRSFEPFMSKDVVKISANVPQSWKLNKKLFHSAFRSCLAPSKYLFHAEGKLPFQPWYINMILQSFTWSFRVLGRKLKLITGNQGPWGEWNYVMKSKDWRETIEEFSDGLDVIKDDFLSKHPIEVLYNNDLTVRQRINFLQTLYILKKVKE